MVLEEFVSNHRDEAKDTAEFRGDDKEVLRTVFNVADTDTKAEQKVSLDTSMNDEEKHGVDRLPRGNIESANHKDNISKGVKRPRTATEESSVRIVFSSLPRNSKRKLEELLLQWSEWHAQNCSSLEDLQEELEHGEETYFPAVNVGPDKSATVSFIMDNRVCKRRRIDEDQFGSDDTPLYEREYGIALTSEKPIENGLDSNLREAARCFNCGSYNHSLKDCLKPRDPATVTNARKEFLSKKTPSSGPRGPLLLTRYYQSSPAGKYDGLKPGVLSPETRKLLGLEELDPPPWLNRMRELGYPPGYLDSEEEDQPSGIMIFGDEETDNITLENGKCTTVDQDFISLNGDNDKSGGPKSHKKMTVDFPGINAPVPENAGEKWVTPQNSSNSNISHKPFDNWHIDANMHHYDHNQWHLRGCVMPPSTLYGSGFPLIPPHDINMPTLALRHPIDASSPRGIPIPRSPGYRNLVSDHVGPYHPGYSSFHSTGVVSTAPSWTLSGEHHSPYFRGDPPYHNLNSFSPHSYPYR